MYRPGVRQVLAGSGEQRNMEETGCEVICGSTTTPAVKGQVKTGSVWMKRQSQPVKNKQGNKQRNLNVKVGGFNEQTSPSPKPQFLHHNSNAVLALM